MAAPFDAFISYSRRASSTLATDLQTAVERFAKPWYRLRAVRVFRDDASMSANTALWSTIEHGLKQAEWLVLLASPAAAASQYVANEVTWWRQHKSPDRILLVIEEGGDIVWDKSSNDFDWERTDCLPRALSKAFAEEPRWIDLRWYEAAGSLKKADPRWDERVADVAAAIRFAERDQLIGENVREHRKAQRLLRLGIAGLSLLLVASLVATIVAIGQRSEAQRQTRIAVEQGEEARTQARIALARQLAAQAVSLASTDLQTASLLAVQAFRTNEDAQTRAALFQLATASPQLVRPLDVGARVSASAATPEGLVVTGDSSGAVLLWEGPRATTLGTMDGPVQSVSVSDDGRTVAAADASAVVVWRDQAQGPRLTDLPDPAFVRLSPQGDRLAASNALDTTAIWSLGAAAFELVGTAPVGASDLAFGPAGLSVFQTIAQTWAVLAPDDARVLALGNHVGAMNAEAAVSGDGTSFAVYNGTTDVDVWRGEAALRDVPANAVARTTTSSGLGMAMSADGSLVATQADGRVEVAAVQGRQQTPQSPVVLEGAGPVDGQAASALAFGGNRYVVTATGGTALLWDLRQYNRFGRSFDVPVPSGCGSCGPTVAEVSPDGSRLVLWASGGFEGGPVVVDLDSGATTPVGGEVGLSLDALTWAGDDRLVGYSSTEQALVSMPATGGAPEVVSGALPLGDDTATGVRVVGDRALVVARSGAVRAVDLDSGAVETIDVLAADARAKDGYYWRFAPDGSSLFIATVEPDFVTEVILVLDLAKKELVYDGPGLGAAYDARSRLYVFDGETVARLEGGDVSDRSPAPGVAEVPPPVVSPEGSVVLTGGVGIDLRLLDLQRQGTEFGTVAVPQQDGVLPSSAFTPDGGTLVTALPEMESLNLGGSVRTLSLDPDDWIRAACAVAARDLTEDDWARYGVGQAPGDLRCVQ